MKEKKKLQHDSSNNRKGREWLRYAGLASEMMILLGGATFLGYKLDQWLQWNFPLFLIIFPLFALAVTLWRLIKTTGKKDG